MSHPAGPKHLQVPHPARALGLSEIQLVNEHGIGQRGPVKSLVDVAGVSRSGFLDHGVDVGSTSASSNDAVIHTCMICIAMILRPLPGTK